MIDEMIDDLIRKVALLKRDAEKCDKGNVSAGTRLRKDLMSLVREIKEARQAVLDNRK